MLWYSWATGLAESFDVIAPDLVGRAGRSTASATAPRTPDDLVEWVLDLLDALGLERMTLIGHSYGAWQALITARAAAERVDRLVLLDPTDCFTGLSLGYRLRAVPLFVRPRQRGMRSVLAWETNGLGVDQASLELMELAGGEYRGTKLVLPKQVREKVDVATTVVLAGRSRAHDIEAVRTAAQERLPHVDIVTLADASHHTLPMAAGVELSLRLLEPQSDS